MFLNNYYPVCLGDVTSFVSIKFDPDTSSFVCTFLNEQERSSKFCNIRYGPGDDCDNSHLRSNKANSTTNTLVVGISIQPVIEAQYCFSATASNGTYTVGVTGIINLSKSRYYLPVIPLYLRHNISYSL